MTNKSFIYRGIYFKHIPNLKMWGDPKDSKFPFSICVTEDFGTFHGEVVVRDNKSRGWISSSGHSPQHALDIAITMARIELRLGGKEDSELSKLLEKENYAN